MQTEIKRTIDEILEQNLLGKDFKFRKSQRETIEAICNAYFEDPEGTVVIDAPTGTGKSIIAMVSSMVFSKLGKKGYIIASDLSLQDQYESDFYRLELGWPSVKGVDNYTCDINGLPFSIGDCKIKGMSYDQASKLPCYSNCEYLQRRQRAMNHSIALLNYSFWLIQRNYVEAKMSQDDRQVPFEQRDFVFFDEAHKVDEVVQNHFSPRVDPGVISKIHNLNLFLNRNNINAPRYTKNQIDVLVHNLMNESDKESLFDSMKNFEQVLRSYKKTRDAVNKTAKARFGTSAVPRDWQTVFSTFDRIKDMHCKFEDYIDLIDEMGLKSMVINQRPEESQFMCVEEQAMIKKYLHKKAGFKVFMSATIGDPSTYMRIMGISNAKFIRLGNAFNYEKSPVVFVNKYRLSMKEKERSFNPVLEMLDKILKKHEGQRGIIHSGSYEFSKKILEQSEHSMRLINYADSRQKAEALTEFKKSKDKILIGPSILEGLDLKDDTSRFQIFFKVPYPSLGDPLIKAKMNHMPDWYDWKTAVSFLQGVGRSVRNENDWAVTYVLDACFQSLINKKDYLPPDIKQRIKVIK
jgi:Rad3-related DNA helicase